MKVIKEGKLENVMRVTCTTCKAELEIEANDIILGHGDKSPISDGKQYYYKSPCCQNSNYLSYLKMPEGVRTGVFKKYGC